MPTFKSNIPSNEMNIKTEKRKSYVVYGYHLDLNEVIMSVHFEHTGVNNCQNY